MYYVEAKVPKGYRFENKTHWVTRKFDNMKSVNAFTEMCTSYRYPYRVYEMRLLVERK